VAAIVIGIIAIIPLIVNVSQPAIFTILSSISIVLIYLSYLLVTVPLLRKRFQKKWPLPDVGGSSSGTEPGFSLGKWGLPVNIVAVLWGGAMTVNLIWPRPEIYNSVPPFEWYLQWGGVLFVGAVTGGGALLYRLKIRHKTGVLAAHAAQPASVDASQDSVATRSTAASGLVSSPAHAMTAQSSPDMGGEIPDELAVQGATSGKGPGS